MEFDPLGGTRRNMLRDPGANLPEPVHLPVDNLTANNDQTIHHEHRSYVNPPTYVTHDKQDVSPSTKDDPNKPTHALDVGEDAAGSGGRRIDRKWTRKRVVVPIAILVTLIAIGAVLGGVLGTMVTTERSASDNSPYSSPNSGDAIVGPDSNVATVFSSSTQILIAQTESGDLMTVEFQGSKTGGYLIKDHTHDADIPQALTNTPIELIQFGREGHLHLFYFDDAFRLVHLVRATKDGRSVWGPGALMDGRLPYEPADTARLSACIMTSDWSESGNGFLMVMYQTDIGDDGMVLLSSSAPESAENWKSLPFYLDAEENDAPLNENSSGLLILPTTREDNGEIVPALRILWDPSDEEKKTTFGSLECTFSEDSKMTDCVRTGYDWNSRSVEQNILDAQKPLTLSGTTLSSDVNGTSTWLVNIIDSEGHLTELRGTDDEWTDAQPLKLDPGTLPEGSERSLTFTSARNANEDLLYAVADGKLMEFGRVRGEDEDDGARWEFLRVVETDS